MKLRNADYGTLSETIKYRKSRIIVYGAGMIGQIVVPYIIEKYGLQNYLDCYVDADRRKIGKKVFIGFLEYEIKSPDILNHVAQNIVILLTCSKFYDIVQFLDGIAALADTDCYIIPMMQIGLHGPVIPRTIHYCWFGRNEMPDFMKACIENWHRFCPGYEIVKWDESNFDVNQYVYTQQAAENGKWSFVSDVARLDILYRHGGIYMDADVMLLKPLDGLLHQKGFVGVEKWGNINTGGCAGAVAGHPMVLEMLSYRENFPFVLDDGSFNVETNGFYETVPFIRHGMRIDNSLQVVNEMTVYPASVFHPYDYMSGEKRIEEDTVSVHCFYGGWMEKDDWQNRADTQARYRAVLERIEKGQKKRDEAYRQGGNGQSGRNYVGIDKDKAI